MCGAKPLWSNAPGASIELNNRSNSFVLCVHIAICKQVYIFLGKLIHESWSTHEYMKCIET